MKKPFLWKIFIITLAEVIALKIYSIQTFSATHISFKFQRLDSDKRRKFCFQSSPEKQEYFLLLNEN